MWDERSVRNGKDGELMEYEISLDGGMRREREVNKRTKCFLEECSMYRRLKDNPVLLQPGSYFCSFTICNHNIVLSKFIAEI